MSAATTTTLHLYMLGPGWGIPFASASPFSLKLETWLRLAGIPYQPVTENNPGKGPKKKSPWIVEEDERIGDSELIIDHLRRKHAVDLDADITAQERALALAWQRTFEEHYHQAFEHELFFGIGGEARLHELLQGVPSITKPIVARVVRSHMRRQLEARGIGRHDPETIVKMGKDDLDAASAFLADKTYFLGERPRTVDACAFGFLATSIYVEGDNSLFRHAGSLQNLVAYVERMRARFFPETLNSKR
ncbi:MAG TPA: glutathione S-transferase family protein [Kofleriaceae bacterium]|nr:glutathione S-transferase family protein [Kofleriaceae bacterium]